MTVKTVPAALLVLMEDEREVRRMPYPTVDYLPNFFVAHDAPISGKLAQLDFDLPPMTAVSAWAKDVTRPIDYIDVYDWVREFGEEPPPESVVKTAAGQDIVVVLPVEFQWVRPT